VEEFESLIAQQIPRLRRYARVLSGDGHADDLLQDTLERSWSRRHLWRAGSDLRAWLFTIMHNLHINRRLRHRRHDALDDASDISISPRYEQQAEIRDVTRALVHLPTDSREILLLVAVEEMPYADIAVLLDVPIGTVMSRLSRARERLRALMNAEPAPTLRRIK
jgi:RNA polymerase sigma-70 factor, ECF subfamily